MWFAHGCYGDRMHRLMAGTQTNNGNTAHRKLAQNIECPGKWIAWHKESLACQEPPGPRKIESCGGHCNTRFLQWLQNYMSQQLVLLTACSRAFALVIPSNTTLIILTCAGACVTRMLRKIACCGSRNVVISWPACMLLESSVTQR